MLRRNGKPRSCEPCRISKIRCDHATPTCEKCKTRGITDQIRYRKCFHDIDHRQCFYHPNPMTKPPGVPRKKPEPRRRQIERRRSEALQSIDSQTHSETLTQGQHAFSSPNIARSELPPLNSSEPINMWPTPPESATRTTTSSTDEAAPRSFFLGSTSYASVFAEERPLPESMHVEQPPERMSATPSIAPSKMAGTGTRHCRRSIGTSVLSKLEPFSFFARSVEMYFVINQAPALIGPLVTSALPQLRQDLQQLKSIPGDPVLAYAEITRNSARPLKVPPNMLASEFHTLFTGQNLRWEALGLVMILAASNAQFTSPDDPVFNLEDGSRIDKDSFIEDMIHASNDVINLCQVHGAVNDVVVWLLYNNMLVKSNFYGDNYHGVWRRLGDTISALYAEGIHCEESFDEPVFLREARRRLYAAAYRSDKSLADFFGRPPMMNWRYSDRKPPLDLEDHIVMCDNPEILDMALSKLDSEGWNVEGRVLPVSWIRLRAQMSVAKERFLEISLAGRGVPDLTQEIQAIHTLHRGCWDSQPIHLRYDLYDEETVWTNLGSRIALRMIGAYLEYLYVDFQIQRLLRRQTQTALPALLEICMKLLSTVLVFNKRRNHEYNVQRHFATLVLFYCLPSAGVLALELRRCTLENVPLPSTVSRADIIRNLSVLISCMEWAILPGDGNHRLCSELNKMLSLVLDEVINYQPPGNEGVGEKSDGTAGEGGGALQQGVGPGFFDIPMIDGMEPIPTESEDFLNWLMDNANWNNTYLF